MSTSGSSAAPSGGIDAGILESSSAWLVGFILTPAEYAKLYRVIALKRRKDPSFQQQIQEADTALARSRVRAKAIAHVLFPRPDAVTLNNVESDSDDSTSSSGASSRQKGATTSATLEIYTKPQYTVKRVVRSHTRLFLKSYLILVAFKSLRQLRSRKAGALLRSVLVLKDRTSAEISLSLTSIALSYKLIYGILVLLKPLMKEFVGAFIHDKSLLSELLHDKAHALIPLISGITAGSFLKLYPSKNAGRDLVAVYSLVRALEFAYNYLDDNGYLLHKPKLIGSWALFPFAYSQLFHSFFFNRDANPAFVNSALFSLSKDFFAQSPNGYPRNGPVAWPQPHQILDSIALISRAHYPRYTPTLMFPDSTIIPKFLDPVKPIIIRAHPAINTVTGALIHPWEPSQFRALTHVVLKQFTTIGKYVFALYLVKTFILKKLVTRIEPDTEAHRAAAAAAREALQTGLPENTPSDQGVDNGNTGSLSLTSSELLTRKSSAALSQLRLLLATCFNTWRTTTFIVMTVSSSWAGIEFSQALLSGRVMPVYRYKIIGFLSGLWAIFDKVSGRGRYIYAVRAAILSYWRVLVKENRVKPIRNGDVHLFALAFGISMALMEISPGSISGPAVRKAFNWISEGAFKDPIEKKQRNDLDVTDDKVYKNMNNV